MERRVLIVDFNHRAHMYSYSGYNPSVSIKINGVTEVIDTAIQSGFIKDVHRWSKGGYYPTVVCMDSPVPVRKAYFAREFGMSVGTAAEYKGDREKKSDRFYKSIEMTQDMLTRAGIFCVKRHNYEADDLIFACVKKAKQQYPGMPIDIMTNDADLLPLVDDTVSVFLRSKTGTYADSEEYERAHYVQVTPRTYQKFVEGLSSYKKFLIPYNTLLLHKILRGDSSDNIKSIKDIKKEFPPTFYNELMGYMLRDNAAGNIDLADLFRYGEPTKIYKERVTGRILTNDEALAEYKKSQEEGTNFESKVDTLYEDPAELTELLRVFSKEYIDDERVLTHIRKMYLGMNLNQAYMNYGELSRRPAKITRDIKGFDEVELQRVASELNINLRLK